MMQDKVSDELQVIQDAWEICDKCSSKLYIKTFYYLPQDPITEAAFRKLIHVKDYLVKCAETYLKETEDDPNPST